MNKTQAFAAGTVLALAALTGCTATTNPEAEPAPTNIHTYAGDSTTTFAFTDPTTAWEDLTPDVQQGMISKATAQNQALVIWGEHVEWTGLQAEIPAEQKQWVERMVERYDATDAPVVFVVGLGSDDLYVERQNLDAPAGEQTVEKVTYNPPPESVGGRGSHTIWCAAPGPRSLCEGQQHATPPQERTSLETIQETEPHHIEGNAQP